MGAISSMEATHMDNSALPLEQWLTNEIEFINRDMAQTLNGRLKGELADCSEENRELTLRFPLLDWEVNGLGTLHGGMVSAMMDLVMSMAVFCFSRRSIPPTISMTTNYLRPIPMDGGSVLIRARLTSLGSRNATAFCEAVVPATGKIACTAIGTYAVL